MQIHFIVAMSSNRVIGNQGKLPWHLPNDLRHFKNLTMGKNILMGRKTFESIKKPLLGRNSYVLSRNREWKKDSAVVFYSKEEVLQSAISELFVVGGEELYRLFLPECNKIYLTLVHAEVMGDTYFPLVKNFHKKSQQYHEPDEKHHYAYSFIEYVRKYRYTDPLK